MSISETSISTISGISVSVTVSMGNTGDNTNIVGMSGGISIMYGKTVGNLSNCVGFGISIRISGPLAKMMSSISGISDMTTISSVSTISSISSVTNSTIS